MKKNLILLVGIIGIMIPLNAKALTGSVSLSCNNPKLAAGESTTCTVKGNSTEEVSAVGAHITLGTNLSLTSITIDSAWEGDGNDGNIQLYTANNKSGNFSIATFTVKAENITTGVTTSISLTKVALTAKEFGETPMTVSPVSIRIPSTVNTLGSLTLDGTVVDGFSASKDRYELTVDSSKTSIVIAATKTDSNSTMTGDTGTKELKYGINTFNVKVTSESEISKTYSIKINRPDNRSTEKDLLDFEFIDYDIKFSKDKVDYSLTVKNDIVKFGYCIGPNNQKGLLCIDDNASYSASPKATINNFINDQNFADIANSIEGKYDADKGIYEYYLNNVKVGESNEDEGYLIIGDLKVGNNILKIIVTAENETTKEYTFNINRLAEDGTGTALVENPKTGISSPYIIGIIGIITLGSILAFIKKKNYFKQI